MNVSREELEKENIFLEDIDKFNNRFIKYLEKRIEKILKIIEKEKDKQDKYQRDMKRVGEDRAKFNHCYHVLLDILEKIK